MDAYHCSTLRPAQVLAFSYVVPLAAADDCVIICIYLVIPMGWVNSLKYFYTFSEALTDVANELVHKFLPVPAYGVITTIPETGPGPHHTMDRLTHMY